MTYPHGLSTSVSERKHCTLLGRWIGGFELFPLRWRLQAPQCWTRPKHLLMRIRFRSYPCQFNARARILRLKLKGMSVTNRAGVHAHRT